MKFAMVVGDKQYFPSWSNVIELLISNGYCALYDPFLPFNFYKFEVSEANRARLQEMVNKAEFIYVYNPSFIKGSLTSFLIVYAHQVGKLVLFSHCPTVRNAGTYRVYLDQQRRYTQITASLPWLQFYREPLEISS